MSTKEANRIYMKNRYQTNSKFREYQKQSSRNWQKLHPIKYKRYQKAKNSAYMELRRKHQKEFEVILTMLRNGK